MRFRKPTWTLLLLGLLFWDSTGDQCLAQVTPDPLDDVLAIAQTPCLNQRSSGLSSPVSEFLLPFCTNDPALIPQRQRRVHRKAGRVPPLDCIPARAGFCAGLDELCPTHYCRMDRLLSLF